MILQEIIHIIEAVAPLSAQEAWDNSGLQLGERATTVDSVLLCLDVTEGTVAEAIQKKCQLLLSHHPLLFHGLKQIEGKTPTERCVIQALTHGLAIYSSHTAMDSYLHGVSGEMAKRLGIQDYDILVNSNQDILANSKQDILANSKQDNYGLGVVGNLPQRMSFKAFLRHVERVFGCQAIKYTLPAKEREICDFMSAVENDTAWVSRVAMVGGAGSEFMEEAIRAKADVFITADCKYHEFQQAQGRIALLDIGHYESEQYVKNVFARLLQEKAPELNVYMAESDHSAYYTLTD